MYQRKAPICKRELKSKGIISAKSWSVSKASIPRICWRTLPGIGVNLSEILSATSFSGGRVRRHGTLQDA